jgi:glycosyltransferase involved in cell wall biosynthesis
VIISLNSEGTIHECLESLGGQNVLPREVIVVDGGSKDGTLSVLDRSSGKHGFPLMVFSDPEGNTSTSRNIGFHASTGEIVAFLDSDCVAPSDWVRIIEANISPGREEAIGGPYVPAQESGFAKATYHLLGLTAGKLTAQFARREDNRRYVKAVPGGDSAFTRSVFLKVGGYDERLYGVEDGDLSNRIRKTGVNVAFVPELYVRHRWTGWNGLRSLARISVNWGAWRVMASMIQPELSPRRTLLFYLAFICGFIAFAVYSAINAGLGYFALGLLTVYVCACVSVMALNHSLDAKAVLSPLVFFVAYGVGLLKGFHTPRASRRRWNSTV